MQFFDTWTPFSAFGKDYGYANEPLKFYHAALAERKMYEENSHTTVVTLPTTKTTNHFALMADLGWYQARKPYYKIWPGVFDAFIKTPLDVDAELLMFSHQAFAIQLPRTDPPMLNWKMGDHNAWIEGLLVIGYHKENKVTIVIKMTIQSDHGRPYPGNLTRIHHLSYGERIEKLVGLQPDPTYDPQGQLFFVPVSISDACLRICIATAFLSTGSHKVLEYDVLAKHLQLYRELKAQGQDDKMRDLERKAKEKGKFGWHIGNGRQQRELSLPRGMDYNTAHNEAGGRELLYSHVRGGHWHTVVCGEKRAKRKIEWFEPTIVRADLPLKPLSNKEPVR